MSYLARLRESKGTGIAKMIVAIMAALLAFALSVSTPVLNSAYADEETSVATEAVAADELSEDETPLASFELAPQCWTHWLFAFGAMVTVLYCGSVVMKNRREIRELKEFERRALGFSVASDAVAAEARQQI